MGSKKEIAIYHPFIDITDGSLIKTAALFWDEMQTIVPMSIRNPYHTKTSIEASREGFLKARIVHPFDEAVEEASREFFNDINSNEHSLSKLVNLINSGVATNKISTVDKNFHIHEHKWSPIYLEKISWRLREVFPRNKIGRYLVVPDTIGKAYMSRLASMIAQHDKIVPLTNVPSFQDILIDRFINYEEETKAELAKLSIQIVRINSNVPFKNILKFRDKHRDELINFRRSIHKMSKQIGTNLNIAKRQEKFKEIIIDEVLPAKEEIEAKLSEGDIAFGFSALDITQATVMGMIASRGENLLAGIGAGLISLTISLVQSLHEDRNIIKDHPLGYLYRAQKKFGVNE